MSQDLHDEAERVLALLHARRCADAKEHLAPLIAEHPDRATLWQLLTSAHQLMGEYPEAVEAGRTAVGLAPQNAETHMTLAKALISGDQKVEGVAELRSVLEIEPQHAKAHVLLALVLSQYRNGKESAYKHAQQAIELIPDEPSAHFAMGSALAAFGRGSAQRAREHLETSLRIRPNQADVLNELARLDLREHRPVRAIRGFLGALEIDPHARGAGSNLLVALRTLVLRGCWWLNGTLLLVPGAFVVAAQEAGESEPTVNLAVRGAGIVVIAALAWWVLVRRLVAPFGPGKWLAVRKTMRSDRVVHPAWIGQAVGAVCGVLCLLPWWHPGLFSVWFALGLAAISVGAWRTRVRGGLG